MEDSLELPEEYDDFEVGALLSPAPPHLESKHSTPPHSLAYSNSTCAKDKLREIQMRSPLGFEDSPSKLGLIKANNENYPLNEQRTLPISPHKPEGRKDLHKEAQDRPAAKSQYKKIQPKKNGISKSPPKTNRISPQSLPSSHSKNNQVAPAPPAQEVIERKTLEKGQSSSASLKRRVRQLQEALHMETVVSEELRTKLSVTNSLLQQKMKEKGLGYVFAMKNSSRDLKNVDIFIELTNLQKGITEKNIIIDRLKNQIKQLTLENQKARHKKVLSPSPPRSPNQTLNEELEKLTEEKDTLISYIDEQKATLKRKIDYIAELQAEINRITDRQAHYTDVERPKIIAELTELKLQNRGLKQQLEKVRMELNLSEMKAASDTQQLQNKLSKVEGTLIDQEKLITNLNQQQILRQAKKCIDISCQKEDLEREILVKELTLLKSQRDHYLSEYRKRAEESALLYGLQLKMAMVEGNHCDD